MNAPEDQENQENQENQGVDGFGRHKNKQTKRVTGKLSGDILVGKNVWWQTNQSAFEMEERRMTD